ncbi:hypothetical protein BDV25DRAFT_155203 [Aspergillus avenaceus]|uniref:Uncharacterized protein n=1 Tax=Aspergillus avenaceus TaxID=36643 RepID=A0A5N6TUS3_ASPAV|nr:hypothetical protein BDV25DRAFT_155203 [Aspergillus avenaceus]
MKQTLAQIESSLASESHILYNHRAVSTDPDLQNSSIEARNILDSYKVEMKI